MFKFSIAVSTCLVLSFALGLPAFSADQSKRVPFGQPHVSQGQTQVQTEQKITQTLIREAQIPTVKITTEKANINKMEPKHFVALGYPQAFGENIVKYRDAHEGKFRSLDELRQVPGVNERLMKQANDQLAVGPVG